MRPIGQGDSRLLYGLSKTEREEGKAQLAGFYYLSIGFVRQCILYVLQFLFPFLFFPIGETTSASAIIDRINAIDSEAFEKILETMPKKWTESPSEPPPNKPNDRLPIFSQEIEEIKIIRRLRDNLHLIRSEAILQANPEERSNYIDHLSGKLEKGVQLLPFTVKMIAFDQRLKLAAETVRRAKGAEDIPGGLCFDISESSSVPEKEPESKTEGPPT